MWAVSKQQQQNRGTTSCSNMTQTKPIRVITMAASISLTIVTKARAADDDEYTCKMAKRGGEWKTAV